MESEEKELKNISELFKSSPEEAISQAKVFLMSPDFTNYDEYIADVKKTQKSNCCIVSWSKAMLSARCLDCQLQANSCICIPCYLAGKHDQHHSYLLGSSGGGNCDCGDPNFWKPEGNCPNHPGPDPNPEITQMTATNRSKFIEIFKIAYISALTSDDFTFSIQIFEWLTEFISIGDGLRRCVAIAVCSAPEETFLVNLQRLTEEPVKSLISLFGKLISDHHFAQIMGSITLKNYLSLRNTIKNEMNKANYDKKSIPFYPIKKLLSFSFHFFNAVPLMYMVQEHNFDWVDFVIDCIRFSLETVKENNMNYDKNSDGQITSQLWYMSKLLEVVMKRDDQHDNIQRFIDSYSSLLVDYERFYSFYYHRTVEEDSPSPFCALHLFIYLYQINCLFSPSFDSSPKNKTFSIEKTFSNLLNFLRSQDDLISDSLFGENEVPVSSFLPLHHLFYCLFSSYSDSALGIIEKECKSNEISLQEFCCLSSICPLRILTAIFVSDRFTLLNRASHRQISYCIDEPEQTFNVFFGMVQSMLFFVDDKDEIIHMALESFGVFEDFEKYPDTNISDKRLLMKLIMNHKNQIEMRNSSVFDASIFIVSLLTDQSIRTYDKVLFKRLRVIELLMNNKPTAKDIENYVSDKLSNPIFGDDLQSFAERVQTSNGSFFRLKDQSEFTPFFPLIRRQSRMKILMKYGDKLLTVPEFGKSQKPLLSCLKAPSFIAAMQNCLSSNVTTFRQVGLAMFVLAARDGPKSDYSLKNSTTISSHSISDLILSLTNLYESSASSEVNPLTVEMDNGRQKRSIIELVQSMGEIGYESITKADLPDFLKPKTADNSAQIQKEKKARAANLKQALMKEFQSKRSQFVSGVVSTTKSVDDDENDDDENASNLKPTNSQDKNDSSEILCNICQMKLTDDVIGFPCLSLPCVFPSLITNRFHGDKTAKPKSLECVKSLSICYHHVHCRCCMGLIKEYKNDVGDRNEKRTYQCMIDRGPRNIFLPLFDDSFEFQQKPSKPLQKAVDLFMDVAFKISGEGEEEEENVDAILMALKSFAGEVLTLEVRHRSRPECLDSQTVPSLLRNLLHTIYASIHKRASSISDDFVAELFDPLLKLVIKLVKSEKPVEEHAKFVKEIAETVSNKVDHLYEFLRRAAIIEEFALKNKKESPKSGLIDWDELLSLEKLVERYGVGIESKLIELPLFDTIPLAERFVGLYQPPYNMDIFDTSISKFVDLFTGDVVFYSKNQTQIPERPDLQHVTNYVKDQYNGGLAMFLGLTGGNASDIIISCPEIDRLFNLDGFYVDQFGDIDRGFKRGAILALSKDRLENALDKFLSGDVILY